MKRGSRVRERTAVLAAVAALAAGCATGARLQTWQTQIQAGSFDAALETIRAEIADPYTNDPRELAWMRALGLRSLARYAKFRGAPPELDTEALRYHREGVEFAPDALLRAEVHVSLAGYYSSTLRNGRSVPYALEAARTFEEAGQRHREWEAQNLLANAHLDRGDLASYEATWARARELAAQVFVAGSPAVSADHWLGYWQALSTRMDAIVSPFNNASGEPNLAEVEAVWPEFERVGLQHVSPRSTTYTIGAEMFAVCGEFDRADELWSRAQALAADETARPGDVTLECTRAALATYRGAADAAQQQAGCIAAQETHGRQIFPSAWRWAGEAHERAGRLDAARGFYQSGIDAAEESRSSFTVAERAAVFRTGIRTLYWGLIRVHARNGDVLASLQAAELVRARQLGEVLAQTGKQMGRLDSLEQLQQWLGPGDALLSYLVMEREVLLVAVTANAHEIAFIDASWGDVTQAARDLAHQLATDESPLPDVKRRLGDLGRRLLLPVADLLEGKTRLLVVPDGALNAIPFDLLSVRPDGYRALIEDVSLRLAPSIGFLLSPPPVIASDGLLAVGDPVYARDPAPGGVRAASLAGARGSTYLRYFTPLPETRTEVEGIAALFRDGRSELLLGAGATESAVKRADYSGVGFLHFATHGVLGNDVPGLAEPALVFSEEPGEDGFLTASEASALDLRAELAVLSACKTGAGDYFSGEGVMGMSRAFLLAGTRSVLVSLWSVDSKATEDLMLAFYKEFRRSGGDPEGALRRAKLHIRYGKTIAGSERGLLLKPSDDPLPPPPPTPREHPYFWAAFVLVGQ